MEKLYTVEQVVEFSQLHLNTIYRHIQSGLLPAHKVGNYWRVKESDLKHFLYGRTEKEK